MAAFKKGAFTVAAKEKVPVVPITLDGTGRLMRNGARARCCMRVPCLLSHSVCCDNDHNALVIQTPYMITR